MLEAFVWPRKHGLFPPDDPLLLRLSALPRCWPFEKHLPGTKSPYELLPRGGWITGDAAALRGVDLRLFYQEPEEEESGPGTVWGAVRFGDGASIGEGFYLSAHGGAVRIDLFSNNSNENLPNSTGHNWRLLHALHRP